MIVRGKAMVALEAVSTPDAVDSLFWRSKGTRVIYRYAVTTLHMLQENSGHHMGMRSSFTALCGCFGGLG